MKATTTSKVDRLKRGYMYRTTVAAQAFNLHTIFNIFYFAHPGQLFHMFCYHLINTLWITTLMLNMPAIDNRLRPITNRWLSSRVRKARNSLKHPVSISYSPLLHHDSSYLSQIIQTMHPVELRINAMISTMRIMIVTRRFPKLERYKR